MLARAAAEKVLALADLSRGALHSRFENLVGHSAQEFQSGERCGAPYGCDSLTTRYYCVPS